MRVGSMDSGRSRKSRIIWCYYWKRDYLLGAPSIPENGMKVMAKMKMQDFASPGKGMTS